MRFKEKKAISDAETKPDTNKRKAAKRIATTAPKSGGVTVIPSNKPANWHKNESESKYLQFS